MPDIAPLPVYPIGTPIPEIRGYDRSIKVRFQCGTHRGLEWVSKDPAVSSWFLAEPGDSVEDCGCSAAKMVTTAEYAPGRVG